jgi:hypothetical protein
LARAGADRGEPAITETWNLFAVRGIRFIFAFVTVGMSCRVTGEVFTPPEVEHARRPGQRAASGLPTAARSTPLTSPFQGDLLAVDVEGGGVRTLAGGLPGSPTVVVARTRAYLAQGGA